MIMSAQFPSPDSLQARFEALLPRIERHGQVYFRYVKCPVRKADFIAEMVGLAWKWFVRLAERGKDATQFASVLASYAARAVKCGRRVCRQESANDALNPQAQQRHSFRVESLPTSTATPHEHLYSSPNGQRSLDDFEERLQDNRQTPVPDQVAFRIDFPLFLKSLSRRDRKLARFLALGHPAKQAAAKFKLSPGRVTQLRQQWCREWRLCQGEGEGSQGSGLDALRSRHQRRRRRHRRSK